jgi:multidrug resistance efflux pump
MKIPILPILALAGALYATRTVLRGAQPTPVSAPAAEPARSPFEHTLAGSGIVEPASQNVAVGTAVSGLVLAVAVRHGQTVRAGELLLRVDDRDLKATLAVRAAELAQSQARLGRLRAQPRQEDLPPARAALAAARAALAEARTQWDMAASLADARALSQEERAGRRFALDAARAREESAQAELALLEAGAWAAELEVADAEVAAARAAMDQAQVAVERAQVRAPLDATVLQVNVREGEYAAAGGPPLLVLGDLTALHVRIDLDEHDAWRFEPGAAARVSVRGNRELAADARFVRIDPFVIPKRALTGEATERVDTRVLQVIYRLEAGALPVYVGQQMDAFVAVGAPSGARKP